MLRSRWMILVFISSLLFSFFYLFHLSLKDVFTYSPQEISTKKGKETISLVTYNIRYGKGLDGRVDLGRTILTLQALDADIISLQEVERYSFRSFFSDQVKALADALGMNAIFYPSLSYPGMYYGNVVLSRFPIRQSEILGFHNKLENRSAIIAEVEGDNGEVIYVLNTHLGLNKEERKQAIAQIYTHISDITSPVLLAGDLNSTPDMKEYQTWLDFLTKSTEGREVQTYHNRNWQIDYLFHSSHFIPTEITVVKSDASDHYPLHAVYELEKYARR